MANCNDNRNPLQRNGTSQPQRLLAAQSPESAPVIDKGPLDWMVWGSRLSNKIRYYHPSGMVDGTMQSFFGSDIAVQLAMVATHPATSIQQFVREQLTILTTNSNATKTTLLRRSFTSLFDATIGYLQRVDTLQQQLQYFEQQQPGRLANFDVLYQLNNHIKLRLKPLLIRAISYYKAARSANLTTTTTADNIHIFHQPISTAEMVINTGLGNTWWKPATNWNDFVINIPEEPSIFGIAGTIAGKIQHSAQHNFFTGLLDEVNGSAAFLISLCSQSVEKLLTHWPNHAPHYTLYLAWLQLMENARKGANTLTEKHLQFYYEDVLKIQPRPPAPDRAFLTLELNKAVGQMELQANTAFIGGKDNVGQPILYHNTRPTIINKSSVASLQCIYLAGPTDIANGINKEGILFASPVANSQDGLGKKITQPLGSWHPFFNKIFSNGELMSIEMPPAAIGFVIASHYLRLKEGKRKIVLKINTSNNAALAGKEVQAWVTIAKKWLNVGPLVFTNGKMNNGITNGLLLSITIGADMPSIVGYHPQEHGHRIAETEPLLKIVLPNNGQPNATEVDSLSAVQLLSADLNVQVGELGGTYNAQGLKNLELHNDSGVLNAAKPFLPFGNEPTPGNALTIGSDEIFYKANTRIQLNIDWKNLPATTGQLDFDYDEAAGYQSVPSTNDPYHPEVDFQTLEAGSWMTRGSKINLFPASGNKLLPNAAYTSPILDTSLFLEPDATSHAYSAAANAGFIRLKLRHDFGHRNYRQALSWYLMEKGNSNPNVQEPAAPYNPVMQSLSISYHSQCSFVPGTTSSHLRWWHMAPFGETLPAGNTISLIPKLIETTSPRQAQGSLFIGLENVGGGQTVSLLFQLMEGTENPLQAKPVHHIHWQYLSENRWKPFAENAISDGTAQWIRSGIIQWVIPEDATTNNTVMAPGLLWIKASVNSAPDAVAKIIGIHSNAIEVTQQLQAGATPATLVAANGSITKMQQPDGLIKKVQHPYTSFGGTTTEEKTAYYARISERLKHKDRAITIWDYERLVLEAFPEIFKAKCLNHTKISGSEANGTFEYNEEAPGYVTIITIPNLQHRNDADPLKPYTKKSTLEAIEQMLQARTSCHVQLHAAQPLFEAIRMAATVMLAKGYEDITYYRELLQQELTAFLSPWAYGKENNIDFGGSIHKSVLINFLEERPYVDYLSDVQLFHQAGEGAAESGDQEKVIATTGRSVLIAAPATQHQFKMLTPISIPTKKENCKNA